MLYAGTETIFSRETFRVFAMAAKTSIEPVRLLVSNCDKYGTPIPAFSANFLLPHFTKPAPHLHKQQQPILAYCLV